MEIARTDSEESERPLGWRVFHEFRAPLVVAAGLPQAHARGQQPALPRLRPDRVAEARFVVAPLQTVRGGLLDLRPPCRQLVSRGDLLVDDRSFPAGRPDDAVPAITEHADERVQAVEIDHGRRGMGQDCLLGHCKDRVDSPLSECIGTAPAVSAGIPQSAGGIASCAARPLFVSLGAMSQALAVERLRLRVRGIVQGVGFRPFVHGLARGYGVSGFVRNDAEGVVIEVEGDPGTLAAFVECDRHRGPTARARRRDRDNRVCATLRLRSSRSCRARWAVRRGRRSSPRTPQPATTACASSSTPPIAATATRSSTARTAARASRSSRPSRTTGRGRRWRTSRSARPAAASTRIRPTGASMPSRSPARTAGPG